MDAAWRPQTALPILQTGHTLKFMFLPDQHDPDTFVREHGKAAFAQQERDAMSITQLMFRELATLYTVEDGSLLSKRWRLSKVCKISF